MERKKVLTGITLTYGSSCLFGNFSKSPGKNSAPALTPELFENLFEIIGSYMFVDSADQDKSNIHDIGFCGSGDKQVICFFKKMVGIIIC